MISNRIKELRNTLNLSQEEFAHKIGMTKNAVYGWESGKVEIKESSIMLIEFVFNVNPDWLRNGEGEIFLPFLSPKLEQFVKWMISLPDNKKVWLEVELEEKIIKYKNSLEK